MFFNLQTSAPKCLGHSGNLHGAANQRGTLRQKQTTWSDSIACQWGNNCGWHCHGVTNHGGKKRRRHFNNKGDDNCILSISS
jgi:hypothetical protein